MKLRKSIVLGKIKGYKGLWVSMVLTEILGKAKELLQPEFSETDWSRVGMCMVLQTFFLLLSWEAKLLK